MTELGIFAAFAALMALQTPPPATPGPLTIDQAAAIAERNAFAVRLQESTVARRIAQVQEAYSNLGPNVTLDSRYSRSGQAIYGSFGSSGAKTLFSPINSSSVTGSITVPIDFSGGYHALAESSRYNLKSASESLRASLNDARLNARSAFLAVLRNQALVDVAQQGVKDAQGRLAQAELQLQQVQIAKIDRDRLAAQLAQSNADLIAANNNLQLAQNNLNYALARPIETPVQVVDVANLPPVPSDAQALNRSAQQYRPESRALQDTYNAFKLIRIAGERASLPTINFSLSGTRNFGDLGFNGSANSSALGLTFSLPIYDSGLRLARVRESRQDENQALIQLEQVQLGISQEVRNAVATLQSALARLNNAQKQVDLASEVFRLAQVRQSAGVGTYVETIDAETSLTQARNGLVSARYDYLVAYSQLQRAVGNDSIPGTAPASGVTP